MGAHRLLIFIMTIGLFLAPSFFRLTFASELNGFDLQNKINYHHYIQFRKYLYELRKIRDGLDENYIQKLETVLTEIEAKYPFLNLQELYEIKTIKGQSHEKTKTLKNLKHLMSYLMNKEVDRKKIIVLRPKAVQLLSLYFQKKYKNYQDIKVIDSYENLEGDIREFVNGSGYKNKRRAIAVKRKFLDQFEKDFEDHFTPIFLEKEKGTEIIHAIVADSFDCGQGKSPDFIKEMIAAKFSDVPFHLYFLNISRQKDDHTCAIFTSKDLQKFSSRKNLIEYIKKNNHCLQEQLGEKSLISYIEQLPPENMLLTQSVRNLNRYIEKQSRNERDEAERKKIKMLKGKVKNYYRQAGENGKTINAKAQMTFIKYLSLVLEMQAKKYWIDNRIKDDSSPI